MSVVQLIHDDWSESFTFIRIYVEPFDVNTLTAPTPTKKDESPRVDWRLLASVFSQSSQHNVLLSEEKTFCVFEMARKRVKKFRQQTFESNKSNKRNFFDFFRKNLFS